MRMAAWITGFLLLFYAGCEGSGFSPGASPDRMTRDTSSASKVHYLSGQVVLVERDASLLRVQEAVELHRPEVITLRLTSATVVLKGNHSGTIDQIQRGDYVLIRYLVEPDGTSSADEIRLVSKPQNAPLLPEK